MTLYDPSTPLGELPWIGGPLAGRVGRTQGGVLHAEAILCPLGPAFIPKGRVGRHHRAISRNGRILLASDVAAAELDGRRVRLRLSGWHRPLPDGPAMVYGILLRAWTCPLTSSATPVHSTCLSREPMASALLFLELGARRTLNLLPPDTGS